ncbi:MAG TPA: ATP-binding protein [Planctomycetota bacterium]
MTAWRETRACKATETALPQLRRDIQAAVAAHGESQGMVDRIGLLVSELTHNAVEAAERESGVSVVAVRDAGGLRMSVECEGNRDLEGLQLAVDQSGVLPHPDSERGRGLWLILAFTDDLQLTRTELGHLVVTVKIKEDEAP